LDTMVQPSITISLPQSVVSYMAVVCHSDWRVSRWPVIRREKALPSRSLTSVNHCLASNCDIRSVSIDGGKKRARIVPPLGGRHNEFCAHFSCIGLRGSLQYAP